MRKNKIEQKNSTSGFLDKKTPLFTRVWFKCLPESLRAKYIKQNPPKTLLEYFIYKGKAEPKTNLRWKPFVGKTYTYEGNVQGLFSPSFPKTECNSYEIIGNVVRQHKMPEDTELPVNI